MALLAMTIFFSPISAAEETKPFIPSVISHAATQDKPLISPAKPTRVLVLPYNAIMAANNVLYQDALKEAGRTVRNRKGYRYVSQDDVITHWIGKITDEMTPEEEESMRNGMKRHMESRSQFNPLELGLVTEKKDLWGVDIVLVLGLKEKDGKARLTGQLVSMDTGKFCIKSVDCHPDKVRITISKLVRNLLKNGRALNKVEADDIFDPVFSKVDYIINTKSGEKFTVRVNYTADRVNPEIQSVDLIFAESIADGEKRYMLLSRNRKPIYISCRYAAWRATSIEVSSDIPKSAKGADRYSETLHIQSEGGYLLNFEFIWNKGDLQSVNVTPATNPYRQVKI